ncbi:hypothetical protein MXEN_10661 [Mycobacterium xenopi RIVM700367]|uniref:DUF1214 domain-containing protein n=1 Tax=Mycobacterium xenopi TaxID=1789 RepID=UPI00025ACF88|nr:DUF1214 domain-containing protein [Mycobacterium xenopi]EID13469.1 hypothetical protein MXEN_10661 [Mycobacterium xenopi RIVM700367]
MSDRRANPSAWLPFSIVEAAFAYEASLDGCDVAQGWTRLLDRLGAGAELIKGSPFAQNRLDLASGLRHLLVLTAVGADEVLRFSPEPILAVSRTSTDDILTWGMDCPDGLYTRATMWGGETYRLFGNRGTARYVGLQTMNGIQATANVLVDELELDEAGNFEVIISADERDGNWLRIDGDHPTLVVRHFFYDWATEVPSSLRIERIGGSATARRPEVEEELILFRQLMALGEFVFANLEFFHNWGSTLPTNRFLEPMNLSAVGAAAENRPVIGRWALRPDEALILEVEPPNGVYWSYSLGNPWWETIHYGRHQSSLNGHQAVVDSDGRVRVVMCGRDPGVANWLDTAGYSNGIMILRCVRTDTAPTPIARVVPFDDIASALPAETKTVTAKERAAIVAARRQAVHERFTR